MYIPNIKAQLLTKHDFGIAVLHYATEFDFNEAWKCEARISYFDKLINNWFLDGKSQQ